MNGRALGFNGRGWTLGGEECTGRFICCSTRSGKKVLGEVLVGEWVASVGSLGNGGRRRRGRVGVDGVGGRGGKLIRLNTKAGGWASGRGV
jgi:hypothetical protein